jgi:integrase
MPRPALPLDTWGNIRRTVVAGKPTAVAYYRDSDGVTRPMQRQGATGAAAERNLVAALRDRLTPTAEFLTRESTLDQLAAQWVAELRKSKRAQATRERYEATVRAHINKSIGSVRIREAGVPRLQRFIDRVAETSGPSQAVMLGVVLKGMFGLAVRYGLADHNSGKDLLLPSIETKVVRAPTVEDIWALREALTAYDARPTKRSDAMHDLADIGDLLIATGGRVSEVLALDWDSDVDLAAGTVTIDSTLTRVRGEGIVRQEFPKSETSNRTLFLPEFAIETLVRRRMAAFSHWVFPSATGTLRWPENVRHQWSAAIEGTSVEWMTTKDCRKAVGNLLSVELNSEAAKEQLGHSNIAVTDKHYVEKILTRPDRAALLNRFAKNQE